MFWHLMHATQPKVCRRKVSRSRSKCDGKLTTNNFPIQVLTRPKCHNAFPVRGPALRHPLSGDFSEPHLTRVVFAIGDLVNKKALAHKAEEEGVVAVETASGVETEPVDQELLVGATFTHPQVASVGLTEAAAKEAGHEVKTATFPFSANGKAAGQGSTVGFVKVVADAEHNEILGTHMVGPDVTELLPAVNVAQTWDLTADEVSRVVFAHPTLGEALKEAMHGISGHMINF